MNIYKNKNEKNLRRYRNFYPCGCLHDEEKSIVIENQKTEASCILQANNNNIHEMEMNNAWKHLSFKR